MKNSNTYIKTIGKQQYLYKNIEWQTSNKYVTFKIYTKRQFDNTICYMSNMQYTISNNENNNVPIMKHDGSDICFSKPSSTTKIEHGLITNTKKQTNSQIHATIYVTYETLLSTSYNICDL